MMRNRSKRLPTGGQSWATAKASNAAIRSGTGTGTQSRRSALVSNIVWILRSVGLLIILALLVGVTLLPQPQTFDSTQPDKINEWQPVPHRNPALVHIIHTRFQQHQPQLVTLGRARLLLFQTFCLPTMVAQTTQDFVWIIHTDPNLQSDLKHDLIQMLRPYPHFILIGNNADVIFNNSTDYDALLACPVYSGDVSLLQQIRIKTNITNITTVVALETRLDADDGLHNGYLQYIQNAALHLFQASSLSSSSQQQTWMYWCSKRHIEWYLGDELQLMEHSKLCISAGITVGSIYKSGTITSTTSTMFPRFSHDVLYKSIVPGSCGANVCIQLIDDLPFCAIRSRTPTSAGMKDLHPTHSMPWLWKWFLVVQPQHDNAMDTPAVPSAELAPALPTIFSIGSTKQVQKYVRDHMGGIAKDNLIGQCTDGHSCKQTAKDELQRLIDKYN